MSRSPVHCPACHQRYDQDGTLIARLIGDMRSVAYHSLDIDPDGNTRALLHTWADELEDANYAQRTGHGPSVVTYG